MKRIRIAFGVLLAALVIAVAGVAGYATYRHVPLSSLPSWIPRFGFPSELKNALFVSAPTGQDATLLSYQKGFVPVPNQPAHLREAARQGTHIAAITEDKGIFTAWYDGASIEASAFPKRGIALSPLGDRVAFAESASSTTASKSSTDWNVVVIDTASGARTVYPSGFAPFFLKEDSILMFSIDGLKIFEGGSAAPSILLSTPFADAGMPVSVAPNHRGFLFMDPETEQPTIDYFTIPGITVKTYTRFAPHADTTYVLDNRALYELRTTAKGTEIWSETMDHPASSLLYTVPAAVGLKSIIL